MWVFNAKANWQERHIGNVKEQLMRYTRRLVWGALFCLCVCPSVWLRRIYTWKYKYTWPMREIKQNALHYGNVIDVSGVVFAPWRRNYNAPWRRDCTLASGMSAPWMMRPASRIYPDPARVECEPAVVHLQDVVQRRSESDPIVSQSEMGKKGTSDGSIDGKKNNSTSRRSARWSKSNDGRRWMKK